MIHLKDGTTLTQETTYPHEVDSELVTSVERVVGKKVISILKSDLIEDFFVMTEEYQLMMFRPGRQGGTPTVTHRTVGCFLKGSDPPIQCLLSMDPRTGNVVFEAYAVKKKRKDGFGSRIEKRKRTHLLRQTTRTLPDHKKKARKGKEYMAVDRHYQIIHEGPVRRIFGTPTGIGCMLGFKNTRINAEIKVVEDNVQLSFSPA